MDELKLIEDVIQICKYFAWDNDKGDEKALALIETIHEGKYGSKEGIWPQVDKALNTIKNLITTRSSRPPAAEL